jgi:hypothetical protein
MRHDFLADGVSTAEDQLRGRHARTVEERVLDLAKYRAVSIWCKRFSVNFGAAALRPTDSSLNHPDNSPSATPVALARDVPDLR